MNNNLDFVNQDITGILKSMNTIAIVGLSNKPYRTSYHVGNYIKQAGYKIFPVNPNYDYILGEKCYNELTEIPQLIDIVNIFRRPDDVYPIVEGAIKIKAKVVWMQLGIENEKAAVLANNAGLKVIMNRCIKIEHTFLLSDL